MWKCYTQSWLDLSLLSKYMFINYIPRHDHIYWLINQAREPYWENIGPRSWPRADIVPVRSRASLVNKRFITRLKMLRNMLRSRTGKTSQTSNNQILIGSRQGVYSRPMEMSWKKESWKKKKTNLLCESKFFNVSHKTIKKNFQEWSCGIIRDSVRSNT